MVPVNEFVATAASIAGWVGALCTVSAYALVTQRRLSPESLKFQGMNLAGAALLACSSASSGAWPSAASNLVWMLIGVQAVIAARHMVRAAVARRVRALTERVREHSLLTQRRGSAPAWTEVPKLTTAAGTGGELPRPVADTAMMQLTLAGSAINR